MANDLQTREATDTLVAVPQSDERSDAIMRRCLSGSYREFGSLVMFNVPDRDQRQALAARQKFLVESLKHEKNKVRALISDMLQGYRHRGVKPNEHAPTIVDLYVRELALEPKIPTWAVWRACAAIRMANDPKRLEEAGVAIYEAPTTMAMRRLCDTFVWDVRAEMGRIGDVLQGRLARPETTPEERQRVTEGLNALVADMKARLAGDAQAGPAPLNRDQLIELAGGEEAFDALPDIKAYGHDKVLARMAKDLANAPASMAGGGDGQP